MEDEGEAAVLKSRMRAGLNESKKEKNFRRGGSDPPPEVRHGRSRFVWFFLRARG